MPNVRGLAGFAAALKQAEGMADDFTFLYLTSYTPQPSHNTFEFTHQLFRCRFQVCHGYLFFFGYRFQFFL